MGKRKLAELNLIDDFMSNAMSNNEKYNVAYYKRIVETLVGKEVGNISVHAQNMIQGDDTDLRGIRLDVEVKELNEKSEVKTIYDLEPHTKNDLHFPRHNRYYQAKIDGRNVISGLEDFSKIHDIYVITITNFDIFGEGYMLYTFKNKCVELPELEYDDGITFMYFNTKGTKGGSEAIRNMLRFIEDSTDENVVDEATREVAEYMHEVKASPEMESGFMTLGHRMDADRKASREEGIGIGENIGIDIGQVKTYICLVNDGKISIEDAAEYLNITPEEFQNRLTIANEEGMEALENLIRDERLRSDL